MQFIETETIVPAAGPESDAEASRFAATLDLRWGRRPHYRHRGRVAVPLRGHGTTLHPRGLRRAVAALDRLVQRGRFPILVHCANGQNRTGCVLIAWMVSRGATFDAAAAAFAAARDGLLPRPALLAWLRRHVGL